jgi:GNAT superfamily N-acetyltransferase
MSAPGRSRGECRSAQHAGNPASAADAVLPAVPFTVGFATPPDVPDLMRMIRALAEYERLAHLVVADESMLSSALFGTHPVVEALIVRETTEPRAAAGFALFFHTFSTFLGRRGLWLEDLFVEPAHRGRGIGRRLLAELAALARARGCGRFEWSVLDWNAPAIGFYEQMGATLLPDWRIARVTGEALARFGLGDADPD